jgi:hypothetical protein
MTWMVLSPVGPAIRRGWELRLWLAEREEISRGVAADESLRTIAAGQRRPMGTPVVRTAEEEPGGRLAGRSYPAAA